MCSETWNSRWFNLQVQFFPARRSSAMPSDENLKGPTFVTGKGCRLPKHCISLFVSSSEAFPSSRLPACCHRLDFKFSKHYSEAALRSGQRNNTD